MNKILEVGMREVGLRKSRPYTLNEDQTKIAIGRSNWSG